jgi:hypothetical protein
MSNIPIGVNQGDTVYYFDQSVGSVVSRDWFFPGGTPTGASSFGPAIQYNNVNSSGYDASLLVTDAAGVTAGITKSGIVTVFQESPSPSISITSSPLYMGIDINYTVIGSTGTGFVSYSWNIPGLGITSGTFLSSVMQQYNDWFTLTGTYSGLPGASYISPVTLSVTTTVGNTFNTSTNATYFKYGPVEEINYNTTSFPYGVSGPYYLPTVIAQNSSTIGLGGSSPVIKIDQSYGATAWNNSYFHSTSENCYFWPNNEDLNSSGYTTNTFTPIQFKTIFSGSVLSSAGASYISDPSINTGNYIKPGFINSNLNDTFYITDYPAGGVMRAARVSRGVRNWSNSAIESYLSNTYYLSNSSKYIENAPSNLATVDEYLYRSGYNLNGGYGTFSHGPCVPTSYFFENVKAVPGLTVDVGITVICENPIGNYTYNVILSSPGGTGNSPDGYLTTVQSNSRGKGIAQILNEATALIGSKISSLSDFIIFESDKKYSCYEGGGLNLNNSLDAQYDSLNFEGLRISITNPIVSNTGTSLDFGGSIIGLDLNWGPSWIASIEGMGYFSVDRKIASNPTSPQTGTMISWLGLKENMRISLNNPSIYFRGWKIGGI